MLLPVMHDGQINAFDVRGRWRLALAAGETTECD
jgi:hypothetical protein